MDDAFDDPFDDAPESFDFEFELLNSEDGLTVTLICHSSSPLTPDEFAHALRSFADRIDSIGMMNDVNGNRLN